MTMQAAFATELSDAQIAALTNHVTKQFGNPAATASASDVARLR
jgi:mono/diheme cytochrome c family protein